MSTNRNVANLSIAFVKTLVKMAGFGFAADMIDGAQECLNLLADIKNDALGNPNAEMIRSLNGAVKSELDAIQGALKHNGLGPKQVKQAAAQLTEAARETIKDLAEDDNALIRAVQQPERFAQELRAHAAPLPDYSSVEMQAHYETILDRISEEFLTLAPWSPNFDRVALTELLRCFPALTNQIERLEQNMHDRFDGVDGALRKVDENTATYHKDLKEELDSIHEDLRNKTPNSHPAELKGKVWGSRPATLKHWVERDPTSNGTTLHDTIFSSPSSQRGSRCVLFGRAGSGKTSLAASIARRCESDKWSLVAWIDASTRSAIESGLIALGESVLRVQTNTQQDQTLRVEQVLATFRNTSKNKCLFVYDNVEGVDYLDGVLPDGPGVHVVVTTRRNSGWSNQEDWNIYALRNFTRDESVTHLLSVTKDTDQTTAGKLASYLGDLPLAVAQAAVTSSKYYSNLHDYYVSLQATNVEELLEPIEGSHYSKGAIASLQLAASSVLSSITDHEVHAEAETILAALCYLAESGMPTQWLKPKNHLPSQKAYTILQASSIIDQSSDGKTTSIHRLQSAAIRCKLTKVEQEHAIDHACEILDHVAGSLKECDDAEIRRSSTIHLVDNILKIGAYDQSLSGRSLSGLLKMSITCLEQCYRLDTFDVALPLQALQDTFSVAHLRQSDRRAFTDLLGNCLRSVGYAQQAIELHSHLHDEASGSDEHYYTYQNNLAKDFLFAGRFNEALALFEDTLSHVSTKTPATAAYEMDLAHAYLLMEQPDEAIVHYREAQSTLADYHQSNEEDVFRAALGIALCVPSNDIYDYKDIKRLENTLDCAEGTQCAETPEFLIATTILVEQLMFKNYYIEGIRRLSKVIQQQYSSLGSSHPYVLDAQEQLVALLEWADMNDTAIKILNMFIISLESEAHRHYMRLAVLYTKLSEICFRTGKFDESLSAFAKAQEMKRKGEDELNTGQTDNNCMRFTCKFESAITLPKEARSQLWRDKIAGAPGDSNGCPELLIALNEQDLLQSQLNTLANKLEPFQHNT